MVQTPGLAACCVPLAEAGLSEADARSTAALLKALADPVRLRLVNLLATSPEAVCVCELNVHFEVSQPTLSHHLKKLTSAGLLRREQRGTWAYYSLDRAALSQLSSVFEIADPTPQQAKQPKEEVIA